MGNDLNNFHLSIPKLELVNDRDAWVQIQEYLQNVIDPVVNKLNLVINSVNTFTSTGCKLQTGTYVGDDNFTKSITFNTLPAMITIFGRMEGANGYANAYGNTLINPLVSIGQSWVTGSASTSTTAYEHYKCDVSTSDKTITMKFGGYSGGIKGPNRKDEIYHWVAIG